MKSLKCFIASAFGKDDVDKIYDSSFLLVLSELNITPFRVDIIEHNDDIDDKIIELIKICDFCIADLTYARPSVYYEAGYFTGLNKPVIYTVRTDHFTSKSDDLEGNLRVHFDLQMKNILDWKSTKDLQSFNKRLRSRINHVVKPIIDKNVEYNKLDDSRASFKRLSQINRLNRLKEIFNNEIKIRKWKLFDFKSTLRIHNSQSYSFQNDNKIILSFYLNSATKDDLRYLIPARFDIEKLLIIDNIESCHIFIISLMSIPDSRITSVFNWFELIDERNKFYDGGTIKKCHFYYHFLDKILSTQEFEDALKKSLIKL